MTDTADLTRGTTTQQLIDAADELTRAKRRRVWLDWYDPTAKRRKRRHVDAGKASLIDMLEADVRRDDDTAPKHGAGGQSRGFGSKPPGKYQPRELLDAFTRDLSRILAQLGLDERDGPTQHLRAIVGIADRIQPGETADITHELEQWAGRLREYAGLERLYRPRSTCPQCDKLGTLTVWIDDETRADRAKCHACRGGWDRATVGLLLEHIRTENRPTTKGAAV